MFKRERHDEFIWALIFSLIVNLLFILTLLSPRYDDKALTHHPFVISLSAPHKTSTEVPPAPSAPLPQASAREEAPSPPLEPLLTPEKPSILPPPATLEETASNLISQPSETEIPIDADLAAAIHPRNGEEIHNLLDDRPIEGDKFAILNYTPPEFVSGERPPYPKRAEHHGWEGTVLLNLQINVSGGVDKVEITKSSGHEILDQQARNSLLHWRFKPARRNGVAIAVAVQQPVIFRHPRPKSKP